jgi:hypothetical protein
MFPWDHVPVDVLINKISTSNILDLHKFLKVRKKYRIKDVFPYLARPYVKKAVVAHLIDSILSTLLGFLDSAIRAERDAQQAFQLFMFVMNIGSTNFRTWASLVTLLLDWADSLYLIPEPESEIYYIQSRNFVVRVTFMLLERGVEAEFVKVDGEERVIFLEMIKHFSSWKCLPPPHPSCRVSMKQWKILLKLYLGSLSNAAWNGDIAEVKRLIRGDLSSFRVALGHDINCSLHRVFRCSTMLSHIESMLCPGLDVNFCGNHHNGPSPLYCAHVTKDLFLNAPENRWPQWFIRSVKKKSHHQLYVVQFLERFGGRVMFDRKRVPPPFNAFAWPDILYTDS